MKRLVAFVLIWCFGVLVIQARTPFCTSCAWRGVVTSTSLEGVQLESELIFVPKDVSHEEVFYEVFGLVRVVNPSFRYQSDCQRYDLIG